MMENQYNSGIWSSIIPSNLLIYYHYSRILCIDTMIMEYSGWLSYAIIRYNHPQFLGVFWDDKGLWNSLLFDKKIGTLASPWLWNGQWNIWRPFNGTWNGRFPIMIPVEFGEYFGKIIYTVWMSWNENDPTCFLFALNTFGLDIGTHALMS